MSGDEVDLFTCLTMALGWSRRAHTATQEFDEFDAGHPEKAAEMRRAATAAYVSARSARAAYFQMINHETEASHEAEATA